MPARVLAGAMCVQRFDDSLNSAIHITYRISLRSSSMPEPRDPLLKVLIFACLIREYTIIQGFVPPAGALRLRRGRACGALLGAPRRRSNMDEFAMVVSSLSASCNDPSAGSPTETLLRLLLPLNDRVWITFRP